MDYLFIPANRRSAFSLFVLSVAFCVSAISQTRAHAGIPQTSVPTDQYFGIYVGTSRIGSSHVHTAPDTYNNAPALLEIATSQTALVAFGTTISQTVIAKTWTDISGKSPLYETVTIGSGGASTNITAQFFTSHIDATMKSGGSLSTKRIAIPSGTNLAANDFESGVSGANDLHVGDHFTQSVFDPVTLDLDKYNIRVAALNADLTDTIVGTVHGLTRCEVTGPEGDVTVYQDTEGIPVRMDMAAGLVMRRESADQLASVEASQPATYVPPVDFAVQTAVSPTGQSITRPRDCRYLRLEVSAPDQATRTITVKSVPISPTKTTVDDAAKIASMEPYLANAPYLDLDSAAVKEQAAGIRAGSDGLYDIAMRTHDWVNTNMEPMGSLGLPRSAASILGDRRGVCRDYATLYTALARAEGVPTRVCAGIVGFHDKFYYHAWAESYLGGSLGWVPIDPTMTSKVVDATHVALSTGDPASIYSVSGEIGKLQATILEADY